MIQNLNDKEYFFAEDSLHGLELWTSDGTELGTHLVKDINGLPSNSIFQSIYKYDVDSMPYISTLTVSNGFLYFIANNGIDGNQLWVSDGTTDGTKAIKNIIYDYNSAQIFSMSNKRLNADYSGFANLNNYSYFMGYYSQDNQLYWWKTDGTGTNTILSNKVGKPSIDLWQMPMHSTVIGKYIIFTAENDATGGEFWQTDGTNSGTKLIKDFCSGTCSGALEYGFYPNNIFSFNNKAYFFASSTQNSTDLNLWIYDRPLKN